MPTMKIYTRVGDQGETQFGGQMLPKNGPRFIALGDLDELTCNIGAYAYDITDVIPLAKSQALQNLIYTAAAVIGDPAYRITEFPKQATLDLENEIDKMTTELPPLKNFILPGGPNGIGAMHLARVVCRRCERSITGIEDASPDVRAFINRLSDYIFTLTRYVMHKREMCDTLAKQAAAFATADE